MRIVHLLSSFALGTLLVAGPLMSTASAQNAQPAVPAASGMTMAQIYDRLVADGYRDIDEIERERNVFEVKARDQTGARVKLIVDPSTGKVLETRVKNRADKK